MTDPAPVKPAGATAASSLNTARASRPDPDAAARAATLGVAAPTAPEPTIGQLVASASRDVSALIRNEIALAKSEVKVSVRAGGLSAGLFAAAAFLMVLAVIMLSVALAYFISMTGLHPAWSFSIIFLLYVLVAALLGFVGYRKLRGVKPPERAIHQAQETKNTLLHR